MFFSIPGFRYERVLHDPLHSQLLGTGKVTNGPWSEFSAAFVLQSWCFFAMDASMYMYVSFPMVIHNLTGLKPVTCI